MNLTKCQQPNVKDDIGLKHTSKEFGTFLLLSRPLDKNHKITIDSHGNDRIAEFKNLVGYEWTKNQTNILTSMGIITAQLLLITLEEI